MGGMGKRSKSDSKGFWQMILPAKLAWTGTVGRVFLDVFSGGLEL